MTSCISALRGSGTMAAALGTTDATPSSDSGTSSPSTRIASHHDMMRFDQSLTLSPCWRKPASKR